MNFKMVFNNTKCFWQQIDIISKLCYGLVFAILCSLFIENFIFSIGYEVLSFREIDDVAFQSTLRQVHLSIDNLRFGKLLVINDYAYGWIFWAPLAILTYPLYLIGEHFSVYWPIISVPRQISLLFGVLSLIVLYKILRRAQVNERYSAVAILTFTLFPTFGYFSLRFGTVNPVMFFSLLSFYLAQKDNPSTEKGRFYIALSLAVAGGIKLSGLLIAPLIFMLIVLRYQYKSLSLITKDIAKSTLIFLFFLIVFSNPALLSFKKSIASNYIDILSHFMGVTKISIGPVDPYEKFYNAIFTTQLNFFAMMLLLTGVIICALKDIKMKRDMVAVMLTIIIASIYLFLSVKNNKSAGVYFTSISFLILLGVIGWNKTKFGIIIVPLIPVMMFVDLMVRNESSINNWHHLNYFIKKDKQKNNIDAAKQISECINIENNKLWDGHVFIDFTLPTEFNPLSYPQACISYAWNNLSPQGKYCPKPVDYLILDNSAPGYLPEDEFQDKLKTADPKISEGLLRDRSTREQLIEHSSFNARKFELICELKQTNVYKAVD